ncbi:amidohydrolase family protein [Bradyrhizobium sp. SYSU BS000235]|uniref:amidohydrolase family protein n=1 Tax=Bradyrhizobium sp. SYSU BS000235 TaxID=3411332 RepID=UPI003C77617A
MTTRRTFMKGLAGGLAFCSCGMLDAASAQHHAPRRLPVMVSGKRIRTVDVHAHCLFHESLELMGDAVARILPPTKGQQEHFIVVENRLRSMDAMGIDMQVLSINPYWYGKDRDLSAKIVQINNEKLAELCASHPDRFAAFASLSLHHPDLAVQELEDAIKKKGLKGAAIGANVGGVDFANPKFHPVLAKAEELGATLFIHPYRLGELASRFKGNGWLANVVGNPLDTTIALQKLIFEGVLDKFPKLKVLSAHGGGYLPSYAPRSDHACFVSPQNCDPTIQLKKKPTEYLNQLYFDSLVFTPEALRHLVAQVGASQIMLGTDQPIPWEEHPVDHVFATESLNDSQKAAILGKNAAHLLDLKFS